MNPLQLLMPMMQMGMSAGQSAMNTGLGMIPLGVQMFDRFRMFTDPVLQGLNRAGLSNYNLSQTNNPYGNAWDSWGGLFGQRQDGSNIGVGEAQARAINNMMGQNPAASTMANYQQLSQMQRPGTMDTTAGLSGLLGRSSANQGYQQQGMTPQGINMGAVSQTNFSGAPAQSTMGQNTVQDGLPGILGMANNFFGNMDPNAVSNMANFASGLFGGGGGGQGGGILQGLGTNPLMAMANPFLADRLRGAKGNAPMLSPAGPVASKAMGMASMGGAPNSQATMQSAGNGAPSFGSTMSTQGPGNIPIQAQLNGQKGARASVPQNNMMQTMSGGTNQFTQSQPSTPMTPQMPSPQQGGGGQTGTYSPPVQQSLLQTLFQNPMSMSQGVQDQMVNRGGETISANTAALQRQMREQAAASGRLGSASLAGNMRDIGMNAANQGLALRRDIGIQGAAQNRTDLQNAAQLQLGAEQALANQQLQQDQFNQNLYNQDFSNNANLIGAMNQTGNQGIQNQLALWNQMEQLSNRGIGFGQQFADRLYNQVMGQIMPGGVSQPPIAVQGATTPMPYPVPMAGTGGGGGGGTAWGPLSNALGYWSGGF